MCLLQFNGILDFCSPDLKDLIFSNPQIPNEIVIVVLYSTSDIPSDYQTNKRETNKREEILVQGILHLNEINFFKKDSKI